ncbi:unnamed protein product [Schistosoma mattheei]|uniref:Uncharacterized protein n=1 Tax=Schistosoma mattheei TaxID=31246 RepID=A0A183NN23_9TREM|nr:unnamed protein product [Schistosoma mattheei]
MVVEGISFTPHEIGEHFVNVFRNGRHIANSPFKIYVGENEIGNASKVRIYGNGLREGMANQNCQFTVDTRNAGKFTIKNDSVIDNLITFFSRSNLLSLCICIRGECVCV